MEIDLPQVMHRLTEQAIAQGVPAAERHVAVFHDTFLADVQQRGRVHELHQLLAYKLKARDLVSDIGLGAKLLAKGRLALRREPVDGVKQVQALFEKFKVESDG
jgi:heterodisulfide reductase subunit C